MVHLGGDCADGRDQLRLRAGLTIEGELLGGFVYDESEDLQAWVERWRLTLRRGQSEAFERELLRLEQKGQIPAALEGARRLLALDPTAETAYQYMMRLYHALGDRAAALEIYRQGQAMMSRAFGVDVRPSRLTRELAYSIEHHEADLPQPSLLPRQHVPMLVMRPPVLAGLERTDR